MFPTFSMCTHPVPFCLRSLVTQVGGLDGPQHVHPLR
jgi:hypothetical protein